jgi:hypothetical protein
MNQDFKRRLPKQERLLLYGRVATAKNSLPKDWRKILVEKYPEYDSLEMAEFLTRVHSIRTADLAITIILEEIAAQQRKEKEAINRRVARHKLTTA